jgi:hypothetical protein
MKRWIWALVLVFPGVVMFSGRAKAQTVATPQEPDVAKTDEVQGYPMVWRAASGIAFGGGGCRVCPTDIQQGEANDCFLLAGLAAIARTSPGWLLNAVNLTGKDAEGNDVYTVKLYPKGRAKQFQVENSFPALPSAWSLKSFLALIHMYSEAGVTNQPHFFYAQPSVGKGSFVSGWLGGSAIWPMVMEKAYAYTMKDGYLGYHPGGTSYDAMKVITGAPGGGYTVSPTGSSTAAAVVKSVSIKDSPSVVDLSHSAFAAILRGDLNSVQPNLEVCAYPAGGSLENANCTAVCPETHICDRVFAGGGIPLSRGQKLHVELLDASKLPGARAQSHLLAEWDADAGSCDETQPCTYQAQANQWVTAGPVVYSFDVRNSTNAHLPQGAKGELTTVAEVDAILTQLQAKRWAITVGTTASCDGRSSVCAEDFSSNKLQRDPVHNNGHEYYLLNYDHPTQTVLLGNPQGSQVSVTAAEFLQTFVQIEYNEVPATNTICGCKY